MKTTHTKGPWKADRMFLSDTVKDRRSGFVVNGPDADPLPVRICDIRTSPEMPFAEALANARLIASAPDMLETLKGCAAMLRESAKMHRLAGNGSGHGKVCDSHAEAAELLIESLEA